MIAEENLLNSSRPNISVSSTKVILLINDLMKKTVPNFKTYLGSSFYAKKKLNEDELTQVYIEQSQILIRKEDYPFNINGQYRDINNLSKGFSDFYFYPNEQNISTTSLYSVECKRLPSPDKPREKEYVIGKTNNGGIERYKIEKHGKGLEKCGLLGFIENESSDYWLLTVNNWIEELSIVSNDWKKDEILVQKEKTNNYCFLDSVAYRKKDKIDLTHLWVIII